MISVFGHKTPDTDSTCSAIAYAWLLKETGKPATPYVLGSLNKETAYVLNYFDVKTPGILGDLAEGQEVVIVDTNNPDELPEGITQAKILDIVDHHKLAGLTTPEPLALTMRPVACTNTIIFGLMKEQGIEPSEQIASVMLAAILSDTLNFTSPTTTDTDKQVAKELADISRVDTDTLAQNMFAAKSDLTGIAPEELLILDSKVFTMGDKKVRISSLETTDPKQALALESQLIMAAEKLKSQDGLDYLFFFIVDIIKTSSTLLMVSDTEKDIAMKAFAGTPTGNLLELPGVVSRKKQMVPPIEKAIVG